MTIRRSSHPSNPVTLDYTSTTAGAPLICDARLQRVLDLLAAHMEKNEGPVGPFMEFILDLVTAQYGTGIVIPETLRYGAAGSDEDAEREAEAFGIARGLIAEHLAAQRRAKAAEAGL